jgi:hypothetical protein
MTQTASLSGCFAASTRSDMLRLKEQLDAVVVFAMTFFLMFEMR